MIFQIFHGIFESRQHVGEPALYLPFLIEELRIVPQFRELPDETLQWILDKSKVKTYEADEVITKTGDPIDDMWILLSGRYDFYWDTNGQLNYIKSWRQGDIGGLLPYSRMKSSKR